ncbi:alpha/beta fold hydrolase [Nocardioides sp. NPDC006273]|uniref:alpha/beta fold hydrolase n=1 Tax=Nocardioides sp. NPDC006273 TaxID=3155598 RepID=UPI0033B6708F
MSWLAYGPDRPLLVVGPSLGTSVERIWGAVAAQLEGWNVIGWDLPGHGASPAPGPLAKLTIADLAAAVVQAVNDITGGAHAFVYAGDSVGGAVGLQLALDHPGRITGLAMMCSAAAFGTSAGWHERAILVRREGMAPMVESSPARWFGPIITASGDGRCRAALCDLAEVEPEGYALVCEALAGYDLRPRLESVRVPLLAVAGADDLATPPQTLAEITDQVSDGRLEVLPGVGHLAPYEAPEAVAGLLREWTTARVTGCDTEADRA